MGSLLPMAHPARWPLPSEGIEGDEWGAYVVLARFAVNILPGMNAGASTYAVPSPIKGSGTAWVLLGSWALSPARPTPIHPRNECRGLSALFGEVVTATASVIPR